MDHINDIIENGIDMFPYNGMNNVSELNDYVDDLSKYELIEKRYEIYNHIIDNLSGVTGIDLRFDDNVVKEIMLADFKYKIPSRYGDFKKYSKNKEIRKYNKKIINKI